MTQKKRVLIVCRWGRNRSRYLAGYLAAKGYDTDFAGYTDEMQNQVEPWDIEWADVVLAVTNDIKDILAKRFVQELEGKTLLSVEVEDWKDEWGDNAAERPEKTQWRTYQHEHTYPKLIAGVEALLPL